MKLNPDCIREVLLYLESELEVDLKEHNFTAISLKQINKHFENIYMEEDIWYTVYNLREMQYISGNLGDAGRKLMMFCEIDNITPYGHQFLNTIRPRSIWDATKSGASKIGVTSLSALSTIAMEITKSVITRKDVIDEIVSMIKF